MTSRTPITLITGFLGSGKTTLCRDILATADTRLALLINEFGEVAIDAEWFEGKNVRIAELAGGCVCCSLMGEFEAAIAEILEQAGPERIIVETTGIAEPDALIFATQESLPGVRLDGVITICDADGMQRFPQLGHAARMQIEAADLILLNKVDLVSEKDVKSLEAKLFGINSRAPVLPTHYCRVDPALLFGMARDTMPKSPAHPHQVDFDSFSYVSDEIFSPERFTNFADELIRFVYRAKGVLRFPRGTELFNFVAGRWDLEPVDAGGTKLVFIGRQIAGRKQEILARLKECKL